MSDLSKIVDFLTETSTTTGFSADTMILAGNSLPERVVDAAGFCQNHPSVKTVIFTGGVGHATSHLIENTRMRFPMFFDPEWKSLSEAALMNKLFCCFCSRKDLTLLLEEKSTHTGENARFSCLLFSETERPKKFWLVQDPLVQKRTRHTFSQEWQLPLQQIQFPPFERPVLLDFQDRPLFQSEKMNTWWQPDYFLSLVLGEVRRLYDDENGYGPKGAGFIPHVPVPEYVFECYLNCRYLTETLERK